MLSSGKIRAGGEIRGVKVYVDIAGSCTRHPHLAGRARRRGRGKILILRNRLLLAVTAHLIELVGGKS
jgi:hypothetical protein